MIERKEVFNAPAALHVHHVTGVSKEGKPCDFYTVECLFTDGQRKYVCTADRVTSVVFSALIAAGAITAEDIKPL